MKNKSEQETGDEMTDAEADYWDEFFTKNPPIVDPAKKGGYFTRQRELLGVLDKDAADYILDKAVSSHKLPAQIIGELVRKEISQTA
jgi:hypothetical protein